jgi:hypothetical protein
MIDSVAVPASVPMKHLRPTGFSEHAETRIPKLAIAIASHVLVPLSHRFIGAAPDIAPRGLSLVLDSFVAAADGIRAEKRRN